MAEPTTPMLDDVPLTLGEKLTMTPVLESQLMAEKSQIESLGIKVVGVQLESAHLPARYFIEFPPGPSYELRMKLEAERFDIGQQMGERMLKFYATKRVIESKGWE